MHNSDAISTTKIICLIYNQLLQLNNNERPTLTKRQAIIWNNQFAGYQEECRCQEVDNSEDNSNTQFKFYISCHDNYYEKVNLKGIFLQLFFKMEYFMKYLTIFNNSIEFEIKLTKMAKITSYWTTYFLTNDFDNCVTHCQNLSKKNKKELSIFIKYFYFLDDKTNNKIQSLFLTCDCP